MAIRGVDGNEWASGCADCQFGLIAPPERVGCSLYLQRVAEAETGQLTFCTCRAGVAYRAHLKNCYLAMHKDHADTAMLDGLVGRIREDGPTVHWVGGDMHRRTAMRREPVAVPVPEPVRELVPEPVTHYADEL